MDGISTTSELARLAARYCWDMTPSQAAAYPDRVILRTMDLGTLQDIIALEQCFGHSGLAEVLARATAGALKPRSWAFWHYRLGLVPPGHAIPPQPARLVA